MNKVRPIRLIRLSQVFCAILVGAQVLLAHGPADEKRLAFTVSAAPWVLTLPASGFEVKQQQLKPDGSAGYFVLTDESSLLNVSFYIEPVENCKDSKACRDMVWKAGNPAWKNHKNFVSSQIGDISYFELLIPVFRGQPIAQQNMYAEFVVDGFWVDMHISKVLYKPEEHKLFEDLVKAVKFEPKGKEG
jgi:hypothetical protein